MARKLARPKTLLRAIHRPREIYSGHEAYKMGPGMHLVHLSVPATIPARRVIVIEGFFWEPHLAWFVGDTFKPAGELLDVRSVKDGGAWILVINW